MRLVPGLCAVAAAMLFGCTQPNTTPAPLVLQAVHFDAIPGWRADHLTATLPALLAQCHRLTLLPPGTKLGGQGLAAAYGGRAGQWGAACEEAFRIKASDDDSARHFYEERFQPYLIGEPALLTGYYEPEVAGALTSGNGYVIPLLARPDDLVQSALPASQPGASPVLGRRVDGKLVLYWTRAEIESGAMGTHARPLVWLRSLSDLFFLQVQGAGRIDLPDGSVLHVGYDGKNGRNYTPIGSVLVAQRDMAAGDVSMQSIKAWLQAHPAQAKAIMDRNEDYVFFRVLSPAPPQEGPPGSLGVDLTAGRSSAVDPLYVPLAAPEFIDTVDPMSGAPWRHLLLAQDSGSDIKGAARTDIFFGSGQVAEQEAGRMHQPGIIYLFLPRPSKPAG